MKQGRPAKQDVSNLLDQIRQLANDHTLAEMAKKIGITYKYVQQLCWQHRIIYKADRTARAKQTRNNYKVQDGFFDYNSKENWLAG